MSTIYRFIEDPAATSSVRQWFKALPVPPEETETDRAIVLYFRAFGQLAYTAAGAIDPKASPVVMLYLPRELRGALWSVGEVHFLPSALKASFPELHKINTAFAKWLRQFETVFSNKPGGPSDWNYYLEGSVKNYDPPVFGLPSGYHAIQNGQYFISDGESDAVVDRVCSSLRLRGVDCA
ncbi:hypothetical protein [Viridibacterium curvum]|uniref:Uncharacterized protein n=1 Tax=Viridibacterium curvum TaxID=1101404 RepID=A0ABP9R866_9RHOO